MGKNKNRGFDLAKRQEKILKKMAQPLYKRPTDSAYLVITEPFGMNPSPAARGTVDLNRLSSWISWVFRQGSVLEAVYTMSTRDEVIIKILEGLDPALMLGKHRYYNILNRGWSDPDAASCVFEYDYQANGDPSAHNWREHVALDAAAPPGHFRNPYPAPTWASRPSQLAGLVHSLPDSLPRTPPLSPGANSNLTQRGEHVERKLGLFSREHDETNKTSVKPPFVKVEPTASIKSEEPAYEPDQALRDEIARLSGSDTQAIVRVKEEQTVDHSDAQLLRVKQEPRDVQSESLAIGPSQALLNEWSRLQSQQQQHLGPATPIKREPGDPQLTAQFPTVPQSPRATGSRELTSGEQLSPFEKTKRAPTAGEDMQPWKRLKSEFD